MAKTRWTNEPPARRKVSLWRDSSVGSAEREIEGRFHWTVLLVYCTLM